MQSFVAKRYDNTGTMVSPAADPEKRSLVAPQALLQQPRSHTPLEERLWYQQDGAWHTSDFRGADTDKCHLTSWEVISASLKPLRWAAPPTGYRGWLGDT